MENIRLSDEYKVSQGDEFVAHQDVTRVFIEAGTKFSVHDVSQYEGQDYLDIKIPPMRVAEIDTDSFEDLMSSGVIKPCSE